MSEEQMSDFFKSPLGIGVTVIVICAMLILIAGYFYRKKQFSARVLTVSAVCIALSAILSTVTLFTMPNGGSVTPFSMLFIVLAGYWFGPEAGIMAGIADGFLNLIIKPDVMHPIQLLLDYPLAFGALGAAGFFRNTLRGNTIGKTRIKFDGLCIGYIAGALLRWFMSFISGFVFWSQYAKGMNPVLYSAIYNITYIAPEMIITLIILSVPAIRNAIDMVGRENRAAR